MACLPGSRVACRQLPRSHPHDLPDRHPKARAPGSFDAFGGGDLPARGPVRPDRPAPAGPARGEGQRGEAEAFPVRQPTANPLRSSGRHRRAVPASLPQTAPGARARRPRR